MKREREKEEKKSNFYLFIYIYSYCIALFYQFSEANNQTLSVLTFMPTIDDDGKYLTCRAENPSIPDSALEDKWRLNVHCESESLTNPNTHYSLLTLLCFKPLFTWCNARCIYLTYRIKNPSITDSAFKDI